MLSFKEEPASMPLILSLGSSKSGISFSVLCRIIFGLLSSLAYHFKFFPAFYARNFYFLLTIRPGVLSDISSV